LTISREDRRNALDAETSAALDAAVSDAENDASIGAVILTGAGQKAFCSGMDMKEAAQIGVGHGLIPDRGFGGITQRRRSKPMIAAVNGAAVAGGFEIALACDFIFAADHAVFGLSEVKRGLFAFAGGVQRLARQLPRATALPMILTGETVTAERLYQLGVVTEVVPGGALLELAAEVTAAMLENSWPAIRNAKALFEASCDMPHDLSMHFGAQFGRATLDSQDSLEGVSAFAEKRQTSFTAQTAAANRTPTREER
jgi:enoyl-CoA hydratase/carnithine racemase